MGVFSEGVPGIGVDWPEMVCLAEFKRDLKVEVMFLFFLRGVEFVATLVASWLVLFPILDILVGINANNAVRSLVASQSSYSGDCAEYLVVPEQRGISYLIRFGFYLMDCGVGAYAYAYKA